MMSVNDYLEMGFNHQVQRIMLLHKDHSPMTNIFSDYVCRINTNGQRKVRVCIITEQMIYFLIPQKSGEFEIKMTIYLPHLHKVTLARANSTCMSISTTNDPDQLIENFRRNAFVLFLKDVFRRKAYRELPVVMSKSLQLTVINKHNQTNTYDMMYDKKFRFNVQLLFNYVEKVGITKIFYENFLWSSQDYFIMILTNIGIILLNVEDMKFKHFIPLIGTYIRTTVRTKLQTGLAVDIYNTIHSDEFDTLIFGSCHDAQDWVTKIHKVQRIGRELIDK